jgi:hypothetical protein
MGRKDIHKVLLASGSIMEMLVPVQDHQRMSQFSSMNNSHNRKTMVKKIN